MVFWVGQAWSFVHPGLAVGALCAGLLPLVIHLINRRRHRRVPWAAMRFLLAAQKRSAKRVRVEQLLLLFVRTAVMLALGFALARPFVPSAALAGVGSGRVHRILLLDDSLSTRVETDGGGTRFAGLKRAALSLLEGFPPADPVSVVLLSEPVDEPLARESYDRRFVTERVAAVEASFRPSDAGAALALATELRDSAEVAEGNHATYVLSDFERSDWLTADSTPTAAMRALRRLVPEAGGSGGAVLLVRAVAEDEGAGGAGNVSIRSLRPEVSLVARGVPVRLVADVTNHGTRTVRGMSVRLSRGAERLSTTELPPIGPGETAAVRMSAEFADARVHLLEASLVGADADALAADDVARLSLEVRERIPVLLVDGRPSDTVVESEAGFLRTALAPLSGEVAAFRVPIEPTVISAEQLSSVRLESYEIVVLCGVGILTPARWASLDAYVASGRGVMFFGGELVSAQNYNELGYRGGAGVLPAAVAPAQVAPDAASALSLSASELSHPIASAFAGVEGSGLFAARFSGRLPVVELSPRAETVLTFGSGEPALIASSMGRGRVLLFTSSAGMSWNNLAAKGDYVALMHRCAAHLLRDVGAHRNLVVGERSVEPLTAVESSLPVVLHSEDGVTREPEVLAGEGGVEVQLGPFDEPGRHFLSVGASKRWIAVRVAEGESDPRCAPRAKFAEHLGDRVQILLAADSEAVAPAQAQSAELSMGLLIAVLALLAIESVLAMRTSRTHSGRRGPTARTSGGRFGMVGAPGAAE